jgi:hypothetical protein
MKPLGWSGLLWCVILVLLGGILLALGCDNKPIRVKHEHTVSRQKCNCWLGQGVRKGCGVRCECEGKCKRCPKCCCKGNCK